MTDFVNEPLHDGDLPVLRDEAFVPVDRNFLRVSLIGMGLFAGMTLVGGMVIAIAWPEARPVAAVVVGILGLLTALSAVLRVLEVRHIAYQVRDHDVSYRSGVLNRTVSTIPFVRVQHARVRQGPVQRRFGLATLEVNSAGPDLLIRGLAAATAERLKALMIERAGDLAEDR